MDFEDGWVNYEAFGAKGDGVTDDMAAICEAHGYANAHSLGVRDKARRHLLHRRPTFDCRDHHRNRLEHLAFHHL